MYSLDFSESFTMETGQLIRNGLSKHDPVGPLLCTVLVSDTAIYSIISEQSGTMEGQKNPRDPRK